MNNININPMDILDARENRVEFQIALSKKYNLPSLALRANYPGLDKNNKVAREITNIIKKECLKLFSVRIKKIEKIESFEGLVYLLFIDEDPLKIKKTVVDLEEKHPLGRLADIDVYREDCTGISRSDIELPKRRCFICQKEAHLCVRSKRHSFEDVINFVHSSYNNFKKSGGVN